MKLSNSVGRWSALKHLLLNSCGSTLVTFALSLPVLLGVVGVGIDFGTLSMKRSTLQAAGDAAALAGAKELALASSTDSSISGSAQAFLVEQLKSGDSSAVGEVSIDRVKGSVTIKVTEVWAPFFAHFLSPDITPVVTSSTASLAGETKICVLSLADSGAYGISMLADSHLEANGCGVYANSTDKNAIYLGGYSTVATTLLCSSGGIFNKGGSFLANLLGIMPMVLTDCPKVADPLALRAGPKVAACNYTNTVISSGNVTLNPGVYCGGKGLDFGSMRLVRCRKRRCEIASGPREGHIQGLRGCVSGGPQFSIEPGSGVCQRAGDGCGLVQRHGMRGGGRPSVEGGLGLGKSRLPFLSRGGDGVAHPGGERVAGLTKDSSNNN